MATLDSRLNTLENTARRREPLKSVPVFILPNEETRRSIMQAEINAMQAAGQKVVIVMRKDARIIEGNHHGNG